MEFGNWNIGDFKFIIQEWSRTNNFRQKDKMKVCDYISVFGRMLF